MAMSYLSKANLLGKTDFTNRILFTIVERTAYHLNPANQAGIKPAALTKRITFLTAAEQNPWSNVERIKVYILSDYTGNDEPSDNQLSNGFDARINYMAGVTAADLA